MCHKPLYTKGLKAPQHATPQHHNTKTMTYDYKALADEVIAQGINLFDSFDEWTKGAFALANLGERGREIFHAISSLSCKYTHRESERKFNEAMRNCQRIGIGSFIYKCKEAGINTKEFLVADDTYMGSIKVGDGVDSSNPTPQPKTASPASPTPSFIPLKYLEMSYKRTSNYVEFLFRLFDNKTILSVVEDYLLGATEDGGTIFWQIDMKGKVRTGKVIHYDPETGHRIKEKKASWAHYMLKQKGVLNADFNLQQCLFGEHLLHRYHEKTVAVVEAEKTAVICAAVYPQYVWLAVGGEMMLSAERIKVCEGRKVILFPDTDPEGKTYKMWKEKAKEFTFCKFVVSDLLERYATPAEKARKIDLADLLIRQLQENPQTAEPQLTAQEKLLEEMEKQNPALSLLIETFDLQLVA